MCWAFALFICALWIVITLQFLNSASQDKLDPGHRAVALAIFAGLLAYIFIVAAFFVLLVSVLDLGLGEIGGDATGVSFGGSPKKPAIFAIVFILFAPVLFIVSVFYQAYVAHVTKRKRTQDEEASTRDPLPI